MCFITFKYSYLCPCSLLEKQSSETCWPELIEYKVKKTQLLKFSGDYPLMKT